jgi:hypothetical protein
MSRTSESHVGDRFDWDPIPLVQEATTFIDAGAVSIGVELRELSDAIIAAAHPDQVASGAIALSGEVAKDRGVSLHVCDRRKEKEYLRFDGFDAVPHYHYISPGSHNVRVIFDAVAEGDFLEWMFRRLDERLPEMLAEAGGEEVAASVDMVAFREAIPLVRSEISRVLSRTDKES